MIEIVDRTSIQRRPRMTAMKRLLSLSLTALLAACASAGGRREPMVRVRVTNAARYTLSVRACSPWSCTTRPMAPGARATFAFPWKGLRRHIVEGWDGNRMAIQVPVDFDGP